MAPPPTDTTASLRVNADRPSTAHSCAATSDVFAASPSGTAARVTAEAGGRRSAACTGRTGRRARAGARPAPGVRPRRAAGAARPARSRPTTTSYGASPPTRMRVGAVTRPTSRTTSSATSCADWPSVSTAGGRDLLVEGSPRLHEPDPLRARVAEQQRPVAVEPDARCGVLDADVEEHDPVCPAAARGWPRRAPPLRRARGRRRARPAPSRRRRAPAPERLLAVRDEDVGRRPDARVRARGRGADVGWLPGAHRAGLRRRRLRSGERRRLADDGAHRQGTGVPGRVHDRPRGAHLPARAQRRRRLCRRGRAPAVLRRGTRARTQLHLSRVRRRRLSGQELPGIPSRFLRELPADIIDAIVMERPREYRGDMATAKGKARGAAAGAGTARRSGRVAMSGAVARRRAATMAGPRATPGEIVVHYDADTSGGEPTACRSAQAAPPAVRRRRGARLAIVGADLKITMRFPGAGMKTILARFLTRP